MAPKDKSASGGSRGTLLASGLFFLGGVGAAAFILLRPSGPELQALEPTKARPGESITLRGKGFDLIALRNTVIFGDRTGRVTSAAPNQLSVEVPDLAIAEGQSQSIPVRVVVGTGASSTIELHVFREAQASPPPPPPVETPEVVAAASPAPKPPPPRPAPARTPAPPPPTQVAAVVPALPQVPPRQFVRERTVVESKRRVASGLSGFDTTGVDVKRAPDVLGRVDFEVIPHDVKPGDSYTVNVYLINDGNKQIKVKDLLVATSVNGRLVSGPKSPRMTAVDPRHTEMVATFSDVWKDVASWAMDVTVTSDRGDVYKNQVTWK